MRDIIPDDVLRLIRDRYLAGVADAEDNFRLHAADEDALTGALGQALSTVHPITHTHRDKTYRWQIEYQKIRGRGPGAPEKRYGADGIFQIEVFDQDGNSLRKKGLLFQSKSEWVHADQKLVDQAKDMLTATGGGIVINYKDGAYTACQASEAVEFEGRLRSLEEAGRMRSLGQLLGNEFLNCEIGMLGLIYDFQTEKLFVSRYSIVPAHVIQTTIKITAASDA